MMTTEEKLRVAEAELKRTRAQLRKVMGKWQRQHERLQAAERELRELRKKGGQGGQEG